MSLIYNNIIIYLADMLGQQFSNVFVIKFSMQQKSMYWVQAESISILKKQDLKSACLCLFLRGS